MDASTRRGDITPSSAKRNQEPRSKQVEQTLAANGKSKVKYPVLVNKVEKFACLALLDMGAGSSYASRALLHRFKKRPVLKR